MKQKILFVMNTMGGGGAEACLINLLKTLDPAKVDITLFAILPWGELFEKVPDYVTIANKQVCPKSVMTREAKRAFFKQTLGAFFHGTNGIKNLGFLLQMLQYQMKRHQVEPKKIVWKLLADDAPLMREEYDVAIAYLQGAATYYVADHVNAKKKVTFMHNEFVRSGYSPRLSRPFYKKFDRIYTVSEIIRREMRELYPEYDARIKVFYNIIDEQEIRRRADEPMDERIAGWFYKDNGKPYVFLTAARLYKVKAFDIAIEAIAIVKNKGYDVRFVVLGEGEERRNLEELIRQKALQDAVFLPGAVENPYPYMKACDCYMQATHYEGCCTSISEAVVLQKPVLASDCEGNKEQLRRYQVGHLVKLTPETLAEGMIHMIEYAQETSENAAVCVSPSAMIEDMLF